MDNLGCVVYTKTDNGNITAAWSYTGDGKISTGTGKGILKSSADDLFGGKYDITYTSEQGRERSFELLITQKSSHYELRWISNDHVYDEGIGIRKDDKLIVGWRQVKESELTNETSLFSCLKNWLSQLFG